MSQDVTNLITVFSTQKQAVLAVAKSILDDAKIEYVVFGEYLHNLAYGSAEGMGIKVPLEKAEEAQKLLVDMDREITDQESSPYTLDPKHNITAEKVSAYNMFVTISAIFLVVVAIFVAVVLVKC